MILQRLHSRQPQRMLPASSRRAIAVLPAVVLVLIAVLVIVALSIFAFRNKPGPQQVATIQKELPTEPIAKAEKQQTPEQITTTEKEPSKQQTTELKKEVVPQQGKTPGRPLTTLADSNKSATYCPCRRFRVV